MSYSDGTKVELNRGSRTGKVVRTCTRKITLTIKGQAMTRDAGHDEPAYRTEQNDGDDVLKSESDLKNAS